MSKAPGLAWLNNFVMAFSVLGGLVGIFIIVMLPIGILTSYVLWKRAKFRWWIRTRNKHKEAVANSSNEK